MKLKICQAGEPVLREAARPLSPDEIRSAEIQQLVESMKETVRAAPGVGLAAPQIGESIQLAVIEDRPEYQSSLPASVLAERERSPIEFHVIINPKIQIDDSELVVHFEGCLSVGGYAALVSRGRRVTVECLNEHGLERTIQAKGWYARILQHEIDHLNGKLYIDRMNSLSFVNKENYLRLWHAATSGEIQRAFR